MNAAQVKTIVENNDTRIINAICDFLRDYKDDYLYKGDYYDSYPFELSLRDYKLIEYSIICEQEKARIELLVEASVRLFDIYDIGMHRIITERFRVGLSVCSERCDVVVGYIGPE